MDRRDFLIKTSVAAGCVATVNLYDALLPLESEAFPTSRGIGIEEGLYILENGKANNLTPEVRPEIVSKPKAVFLIETHVDAKKDKEGYEGYFKDAVIQLRAEGKRVASELFVKGSLKGGSTFIKPNFTYVPEHRNHRTNGVYSSPDFIVGIVDYLREIGNRNVICGEGPTNAINHRHGGVYEAFDSGNVNMIEFGYEKFTHYKKNELNWFRAPDSLIWKNIPYCRPVGDKDNFLINIAKLKVHETAITTLTVKNLQGCVPKGYGQFCTTWESLKDTAHRDSINFKRDFHEDFQPRIESSYRKHLKEDYKRFDHTGSYRRYLEKGGWEAYQKTQKHPDTIQEFIKYTGTLMQEEMWIQRGLDNAAILKPRLNIIEGIIGLDGTALNHHKIGEDYLCNIVIAGLSPFEVDTVGNYIMGHDPNEIWYTRTAKERGLGECDINRIEIYWIKNGDIVPVKNIGEIKRFQLGLNWALQDNPSERLFW